MSVFQKLDNWLIKVLWHKSDTPETLEHKIYITRNGILAATIIFIALCGFPYFKLYKLLLLISPVILFIVIMVALIILVKRGIKWFMYFYYGGYIIVCCLIILKLGGLPNSLGIWGGAFIVFMHSLAIKDKRIGLVNAFLYVAGLSVIVFSYPYLTSFQEWNPDFNNFGFTVNETWMCLFLVKSFYDSIIKRTKEAKRHADHLQELDILKSKLYANITHEFRTPLTLIRGNSEEIRELHKGEISEKAASIVQSSDKILFLVNQMLNLSKIEEGSVPMHYIQCNLVAFVRFIVSSFEGFAEQRKVRLHYEPQCNQIIMDIEPEKLEESIANLLSNAINYTPDGGDVFITIRRLSTDKIKEHQAEISVRDTGIGIPTDQLDKIFVRFYRVEDSRFPYQEGTGIGLTLVNEYIKLMKGSIRVNSTVSKGTDFVFTLPITNNAKIDEMISLVGKFIPTEEISNSGSIAFNDLSNRYRLLIIEDNLELRDYLHRLLENDYQILSVENGIEGIRLATEHIPDIILSDIMMPGKGGYQVCSELKNDYRTNHIPVVLLTARADVDSRISGLKHGADAYLTKPFNKKELMICLQNLLLHRETLRLKFSTGFYEQPLEKEVGLNGKFLDRVISYLEKNYKNDLYGIQNLYTDMGVSRVQLHRKLTALTGQSASNFIRNFRLQKAKRLLLETGKSISDIAFEVGIADPNYFTRTFSEENGITPTDLRKSAALDYSLKNNSYVGI